jgi:hypothetical protein
LTRCFAWKFLNFGGKKKNARGQTTRLCFAKFGGGVHDSEESAHFVLRTGLAQKRERERVANGLLGGTEKEKKKKGSVMGKTMK